MEKEKKKMFCVKGIKKLLLDIITKPCYNYQQ